MVDRELEEELEQIKKELEGLKKRYRDEILHLLERRGYVCLRSNPTEGLVLPPDCGPEAEERFYDVMKHYSFRIFMRDVIKRRRSFGLEELLQYCNEETVRNYIKVLLEIGIIKENDPAGYRLFSDSVSSFGDTLEWFVARIFEKEFHSPSSYGINMRNTRSGGDYDVIALVEGNLLYLEVKSSPPKHIESREVSSFLDRVEELRPDLAVFFEDTELRLRDKIVPMFREELTRYGRKNIMIRSFPDREDDVYSIGENLFVMNSRPDIVTSIGFLLKNFLQNRNDHHWERAEKP
jgi:hypothetical protein